MENARCPRSSAFQVEFRVFAHFDARRMALYGPKMHLLVEAKL